MLLVVAGHLLVGARYGMHGDEMYFVACGRRLAAGYVDHPPLVPLIARAACAFGGCDVVGLRVAPLLARIATIVLTIALVRSLSGGLFAETIAGLAIVFAPAYLRMGKILCIPVFEPVFWTSAALVILHLSRGAARWWWVVLGVLVGVGTLNKHTMLVWAVGATAGTLLVPALRTQVRSVWPWLGVLVAALVSFPNIAWQLQNQWATIEFLRSIRSGMLSEIPRALFALGQLLYMHPFSALLWLPGLWLCITARDGRRVFGVVYLGALTTFLVTHGKPYYLSAAYPPLLAVGAAAWERWLTANRSRGAFLATQLATGLALAVLTLPALALPRLDAAVGSLLGRFVPPMALTYDLHAEYGWKDLTASVAEAWRTLSPDEQRRTQVVTRNYAQAGAIDHFGRAMGLPSAASGHMNYFLWGPGKPDADAILAVGLPAHWLGRHCREQQLLALADHPLAVPGERRTPIVFCRRLAKPVGAVWRELKRYDHSDAGQPAGEVATSEATGK